MSETMTGGERRARAYAEQARRYGLEATVTTEDRPAELYSSGEIMLPAARIATVKINETYALGDHLYAMFRSVLPGQAGHNATTRYIAGSLIRPLSRRTIRNFGTERKFALHLSVYSYGEKRENA
jgi:hypothetical protein